MAHVILDHAISFLAASVRLTGDCGLMDLSEDSPDSKARKRVRWDVAAHDRLRDYLSEERRPGMRLLTFDELAEKLQRRFAPPLNGAPAAKLLTRMEETGILAYHELTWPHSKYLGSPTHDSPSTLVAFHPNDAPAPDSRPHWREYLLDTGAVESSSDDEIAAVFNVLGFHAQRRTLLSVSTQRRLYKIALPWGRVRFERHDRAPSREYMLVPVLTLLSAGRSARYRRTVTLSIFLLQNGDDPARPLTTFDLARLCHQAVWLPRRPKLPKMIDVSPNETPSLVAGPLKSFLRDYLTGRERYLPDIFDAVMRRAIAYLDVAPTGGEASVMSRLAISRTRSAIFGAALDFDCERHWSVWKHLTMMRAADRAAEIGSLVSVNAGRDGREWLIDGEALQLEKIRVTNPFEEDTNPLAFYNPMSRFFLNIMPKDSHQSLSVNFGIAWLNLLAVTVCTAKEILRSYRHEIEVQRATIAAQSRRIEKARELDFSQPVIDDMKVELASMLQTFNAFMLTTREELDVVYGLELTGQAYKTAYARMLDMENIPQERDRLLLEIDHAAQQLRSEQADELSREIAANTRATAFSANEMKRLSHEIAKNTSNTDRLTFWVLAFAIIAIAVGLEPLIATLGKTFGDTTAIWIRVAVYVIGTAVFFLAREVGRLRTRRPPVSDLRIM